MISTDRMQQIIVAQADEICRQQAYIKSLNGSIDYWRDEYRKADDARQKLHERLEEIIHQNGGELA